MKKILITILCSFSLLVICMCVIFLLYTNGIKKVSNDSKEIEFVVKKGNNFYNIASSLKSQNLIKSEFWYKIYVKFNNTNKIKEGTYKLSKNMSVKEIVKTLSDSKLGINGIKITFKEGNNMYDVIDGIIENTNNTKEDIDTLLSDTNYIDSLIEKYWFINDEVKNENIYYTLEGYLYPDTYQIKKDASVSDIFTIMLDEMDKKLTPYRDKIEKSEYSIHEILTLASIVELEGTTKEDRKLIAGVFENRLKANMNLGSDVTTYYGAKVRLSERDLYASELQDENSYNTRSSKMIGKLPVGPICNPSIESIDAVLEPELSDYYYFVADKNHKTYFTKTENEHTAKIKELKEASLWYEY